LGGACVGELRRFGVDTRHVARTDGRVGIYFLESGAAHRPSRVVYDREASSIALAGPGTFDWDAILRGARWFHVSGITPAVSASAARLCLEAVEAARGMGITVSLDVNHRANLWQYGKRAPEVMREIMRHVHVGIAGREDCQKALGVDFPADASTGDVDVEHYRRLAERVLAEFPNLEMQVITLRESHSATHNGWSACLLDRERFAVSRRYDLTDIVDRVGGGDAFSAGLVYGMLTYGDAARALEFATAASTLKHTIPGDFNRASVAEVEALMGGDGSGRVQR
jgi:2-dehydro-3-deoxygluconokinase